jgi:hypothetical protein
MKKQLGAPILAIAFALAMVSAASLRGETRENSSAQICAMAAWPIIPAHCLDRSGHGARDIRLVGPDVDAFDAEENAEAADQRSEMIGRFAADFD